MLKYVLWNGNDTDSAISMWMVLRSETTTRRNNKLKISDFFFRAVAESASVFEECDDIFFSCSSWWRFSYHFNDDVIKGRKTNSDKMRDVSRFSFLFFSLMRWGRLSFTMPWYGEFSAVFYVLPINHHHKWQATCFDCLHVPFEFFSSTFFCII